MSGRRHIGRLPRQPRVAVLGPRDLVLLRALHKARVMRTSDFTPVILPSKAIARRRLRRLLDGGFVLATVVALHDENRWQISAKGLEVLFGAEAPRAHPPSRSTDATTHHFMLVRFWACLVRACFLSSTTKLQRFSFEWELAPDDRVNTIQVHRPDAIFVVSVGGERSSYFVEVDAGTESPSYVAAHKIAVFERILSTRTPIAGVVPNYLLVLAPTTKRLRAIARAATSASPAILAHPFAEDTSTLSLASGWQPLSQIVEEGARQPEGQVPA